MDDGELHAQAMHDQRERFRKSIYAAVGDVPENDNDAEAIGAVVLLRLDRDHWRRIAEARGKVCEAASVLPELWHEHETRMPTLDDRINALSDTLAALYEAETTE